MTNGRRSRDAAQAEGGDGALELALLDVRPGQGAAFESAFAEAQALIAAQPGYRRHEVRRCVEAEARYLLLVWWDTVEHHTEGFRRSPAYARWRALLHHFYDPFPTVEHYLPVPGLAARAPVPGAGRAR